MVQHYFDREWTARRSRIAKLYTVEGKTIEQVRQVLSKEGFIVTSRVLRNKMHEWKLDKKHKPSEMRTALHILSEEVGSYGYDWPSGEPLFEIRGRLVPFKEILRYFRRKNIYDPFGWLEAQPSDDFQPCPDVILMPPPDTRPMSEMNSSSSSDISCSLAPSPRMATSFSTESSQSALIHGESLTLPLNNPRAAMESPLQYRMTEQLVWLAASYCASYQDSRRASEHVEPLIHLETLHGGFGHQMQDGISAILQQNNYSSAVCHFDSAFNMLGAILKDDHPMSLAQLYAVICELAARAGMTGETSIERDQACALQQVLVSLVRHIAELSPVKLHCSHPITAIFAALTKAEAAEQISQQSLKIMQSMVDSFTRAELQSASASYWKLLYLKERYCDCLYHACETGTRQSLRAQLLNEQEGFYGKTARNVLWTLTNVADDHLYNLKTLDAERLYEDALQRTQSLEGFAKAKIRFAALEGLAKTAQLQADIAPARSRLDWCASSNATSTAHSSHIRFKLLKEAESSCARAETEAGIWFGRDSRRTIRVTNRRLEIVRELRKIDAGGEAAPMPE